LDALYEFQEKEYREIFLLGVAETLAEIVSCPIYIRKETRKAAILTIFALGEPSYGAA